MGTTLLLLAMIAPANPGQFIGVQNQVAFENQRQAVEHFHIVGNPGGQSRLAGQYPAQAGGRQSPRGIGQAEIMYDLAIHPSSVGSASRPHPAMRIPSAGTAHYRSTQASREHEVRTGPRRTHPQKTQARGPTPVKRPQATPADRHRGRVQRPQAQMSRHRPDGATPAQAMTRIRNMKALAKEAKRRNLSDIAGWLHAEAERLSQRVRTLQERRTLQRGLGQERQRLSRELDRIRRMEQLLGEIAKAEKAGHPRRAKALTDKLRGLAERRHRPH